MERRYDEHNPYPAVFAFIQTFRKSLIKTLRGKKPLLKKQKEEKNARLRQSYRRLSFFNGYCSAEVKTEKQRLFFSTNLFLCGAPPHDPASPVELIEKLYQKKSEVMYSEAEPFTMK